MISLETLSARLANQTLDQRGLIIPTEARSEAIGQALEKLNSFLGMSYAVAGVNGAPESTLPLNAVYALLVGARAYGLSYLSVNRAGNLLKPTDTLDEAEMLLRHLWRQFDAELDRLRLLALQSAGSVGFGHWEWVESRGFEG